MYRTAFALAAATAVARAAGIDASTQHLELEASVEGSSPAQTPVTFGKPTVLNSGLACPSYDEMQSGRVRRSFDVRKMHGFFYELAYHDFTQFPACPMKPRCVTSDKVVDLQKLRINDTFTLGCGEAWFPVDLGFHILPDRPGYLMGFTNETGGANGYQIPDTVVDFKESTDWGGQYDWVLELQCTQLMNVAFFVGINFYSKHADEKSYQEMMKALVDQGLEHLATANLGIHRVHHGDDCWYHKKTEGSAAALAEPVGEPAQDQEAVFI